MYQLQKISQNRTATATPLSLTKSDTKIPSNSHPCPLRPRWR
jgi:hypothetical protein